MRRKKVEKQLFSFLMWLPLVVIGFYLIGGIFAANQTGNIVNIINPETIFLEIAMFLTGGDLEYIWPTLGQVFFDLGTIIGIPEVYSLILAILIPYWITIEFAHILYDFIILLPRLLRSMIERGLND